MANATLLHWAIEAFFVLVLWFAVWSIQRDVRAAWRKLNEKEGED
jgi:hypothetical protein